MHAATNTAPKADGRVVPWNKGKLIGERPPLKLKDIGSSGFDFNWIIEPGNSRCSISPSTASCAGAIWSGFTFAMCSRGVTSPHARLSCRKKTQRPVQFEGLRGEP